MVKIKHNRAVLTQRNGCKTNLDSGSLMPIVALFLVVAAIGVWGLATFGSVLIERAQARNAADAAALAAALGTDEDALSVAAANGAVLVAIERFGAQVEVKVQVGRAHARARAKAEPQYQPAQYHQSSIP